MIVEWWLSLFLHVLFEEGSLVMVDSALIVVCITF